MILEDNPAGFPICGMCLEEGRGSQLFGAT